MSVQFGLNMKDSILHFSAESKTTLHSMEKEVFVPYLVLQGEGRPKTGAAFWT